jgi:hypothetical protein
MRRVISILLLALTLPLHAQDTVLRHDDYLAFMGQQGETVTFDLKSIARPPFHTDLQLLVLDSQSRQVCDQVVPVGGAAKLDFPVQTEGLHVLAVQSDWCMATARRVGGPFALVAWEQTPLNICGSFAKHYFFVPKGLSKFEIGLGADVTGEGTRLGLTAPDGTVIVDLEDDFDTVRRVKVDVPKGMDGQVWAITLDKPQDPKLVLDDVLLWLGRGLPPYLCEQPEWLAPFVTSMQPEQISLRVPLQNATLRDGATVTVTFDLPAMPQAKMLALRALAQDVDYTNEGTFRLNGSAPYMVPPTGDGATALLTIMLKREDLKVGENVLEFKHDNHASSAMGLTEMELLAGELIRPEEEW